MAVSPFFCLCSCFFQETVSKSPHIFRSLQLKADTDTFLRRENHLSAAVPVLPLLPFRSDPFLLLHISKLMPHLSHR
ncbi:hypothetical protein SLE2022_310540 [Rubroshorea leprosula]